MNEEAGNAVSSFFRKSINILFVDNPRGTSLGIILGVLVEGVVAALGVTTLKIWHYAAAGILCFNIHPFLKRNKIPEQIEEAIVFIDEQVQKKRITELQARGMYMELYQKVLQNIHLDEDMKEKNKLMEDLLK